MAVAYVILVHSHHIFQLEMLSRLNGSKLNGSIINDNKTRWWVGEHGYVCVFLCSVENVVHKWKYVAIVHDFEFISNVAYLIWLHNSLLQLSSRAAMMRNSRFHSCITRHSAWIHLEGSCLAPASFVYFLFLFLQYFVFVILLYGLFFAIALCQHYYCTCESRSY